MKKVLLLILSICSTSAFSGEYSNIGKITRIQTNGWKVGIIMDVEMKNVGCTHKNQYMLELTADDFERKQLMYSTLLSAKMAGKNVKVWLNGCYEDFPLITDIIVGVDP